MNSLTIILVVAIIAVIAVTMRGKITKGSSCCGEHEAPVAHVRAADPNPAHYPYHYVLKVEGMVCANCAKRVENAFNRTGEMCAGADLGKKEVRLSSMRTLDRREAAQMVAAAGYTLTAFTEG